MPRRYIKVLERGSTQPHVIKFDDGQTYLTKFRGNPRGDRVLINEFVTSELLKVLNYSGLQSRIVGVDAFFIETEPELKRRDLRAGLQFGVPFIRDHEDFNREHIPYLVNRDALPQVITFDTYVCNNDRTSGNLLIAFEDETRQKKAANFFLIDHTEAFGGSWTEQSLASLKNSDQIYMDAVNFDHVPAHIDAFDPFLLTLEALTPETIKGIVQSVPGDWRLPLGDASALSDFLIFRKDKVRSIIRSHTAHEETKHAAT